MKHTPHTTGTLASRLRTLLSGLAATSRETASMLHWSHATVSRRIARPETLTITEAEQITEAANERSATKYRLMLQSTLARSK